MDKIEVAAAPEVKEVVATPEAPKEPEKKAETSSKEDDARFAALAKKEKLAQRAVQELKAERAAKAQLEARLKELEEKAAKKPSTPLEALMNAGYTYEDATSFILNNQKLTPDQQLRALEQKVDGKLSALEEREKQKAQEQAKAAEAEYARVIAEHKEEITSFIDAKADQYELTKLMGYQEYVFQTIEAHFNETGKVLSIPEAADLTEKFLEGEFERASKTKKLSAKFQPPKVEEKEGDPKKEAPKTLSNSAVSSTASLLPAKNEAERIQRALAALERGA